MSGGDTLYWYGGSWERPYDFKPDLVDARRSAYHGPRWKYLPPAANMKRRLLAAGISNFEYMRATKESSSRRGVTRLDHSGLRSANQRSQSSNGTRRMADDREFRQHGDSRRRFEYAYPDGLLGSRGDDRGADGNDDLIPVCRPGTAAHRLRAKTTATVGKGSGEGHGGAGRPPGLIIGNDDDDRDVDPKPASRRKHTLTPADSAHVNVREAMWHLRSPSSRDGKAEFEEAKARLMRGSRTNTPSAAAAAANSGSRTNHVSSYTGVERRQKQSPDLPSWSPDTSMTDAPSSRKSSPRTTGGGGDPSLNGHLQQSKTAGTRAAPQAALPPPVPPQRTRTDPISMPEAAAAPSRSAAVPHTQPQGPAATTVGAARVATADHHQPPRNAPVSTQPVHNPSAARREVAASHHTKVDFGDDSPTRHDTTDEDDFRVVAPNFSSIPPRPDFRKLIGRVNVEEPLPQAASNVTDGASATTHASSSFVQAIPVSVLPPTRPPTNAVPFHLQHRSWPYDGHDNFADLSSGGAAFSPSRGGYSVYSPQQLHGAGGPSHMQFIGSHLYPYPQATAPGQYPSYPAPGQYPVGYYGPAAAMSHHHHHHHHGCGGSGWPSSNPDPAYPVAAMQPPPPAWSHESTAYLNTIAHQRSGYQDTPHEDHHAGRLRPPRLRPQDRSGFRDHISHAQLEGDDAPSDASDNDNDVDARSDRSDTVEAFAHHADVLRRSVQWFSEHDDRSPQRHRGKAHPAPQPSERRRAPQDKSMHDRPVTDPHDKDDERRRLEGRDFHRPLRSSAGRQPNSRGGLPLSYSDHSSDSDSDVAPGGRASTKRSDPASALMQRPPHHAGAAGQQDDVDVFVAPKRRR